MPEKSAASRSVPLDPTGRLQVIECADDTTGDRLFAVYDGLAVLGLWATHEQSVVFMRRHLSGAWLADSHGKSTS